MGYDSDHPLAAGRGRPGRRGDRLHRGHGGAVRRHPARPRLDVDDHQRHGGHPAGALHRRRRGGRASTLAQAVRHDPERHPEGIRRARHLHLSAARLAAHRHRHLRLLRTRAAATGTPSRSAAITSAKRARPRCRKWRSPSRTPSPTCRRRSTPGSTSTSFGQRLSFFFNAHNNFLEEIAKFRAARRLWARIMRDRFGATNPRAQQLRFHTQTAGSTLTAQQPDNNIVRVALQAMAAVLGGTQSLHCNGRDEALGAADRGSGAARAAHAADHRGRDRRRQHRRSGRRLVRDRGSSPTRSSAGAEDLLAAHRRAWAARWRRSRPGSSSARSRTRRTAPSRPSTRARRWSSASTVSTDRGATTVDVDVFRIDPEIERRQIERVRQVRASRRRRRLAGSASTAVTQAAARRHATWCPRDHHGGRSARHASARSRTRCARVFGEYRDDDRRQL